jgi:hypothetical protein
VRRLRRWTAGSWTVPAEPAARAAGPGAARGAAGPAAGSGAGAARRTRADVTAAAVQRIADLGADAEARPRRPVPRLADTVLTDQLAVVADDVLRTGDPAAAATLAAELTALRAALGFAPDPARR